MPIERYVAGSGQGLTWGNAISPSLLNGFGSGGYILSDIQIDNSVTLDMFADISMSLASQTWSAGGIGVSLYPLNQDGTTYGDGRFTVAVGGGTIGGEYFMGTIPVYVSGSAVTQQGALRGILIPPGKFKFVFATFNNTLVSSNNNKILYRTYCRQVN